MRHGPNLQNIPIRSDQGARLKELLRKYLDQSVSADELWEALDLPDCPVLPDYSAVEIRLAQRMAKEGRGLYGEKP